MKRIPNCNSLSLVYLKHLRICSSFCHYIATGFQINVFEITNLHHRFRIYKLNGLIESFRPTFCSLQRVILCGAWHRSEDLITISIPSTSACMRICRTQRCTKHTLTHHSLCHTTHRHTQAHTRTHTHAHAPLNVKGWALTDVLLLKDSFLHAHTRKHTHTF